MSINGISSGRSETDLIWAYGLSSTASTSSASESDSNSAVSSSSASTESDSVNFSKPAEMLSKLKQLQTEDPEKFKQVISDIISKLQSASQEEQDSPFAGFLDRLTKKFESVAETGDLSQLEPGKSHSKSHEPHKYYPQPQQMSLSDFTGMQNGQGNKYGLTGDSSFGQIMQGIFNTVDEAVSG